MNVTIIGTGNMAKAIGTRLLAGGNSLNLHAKDASKGAKLAEELTSSAQNGATVAVKEVGSPTDDVVILAVPYPEVAAIAKQYGDKLDGKVVVDITNPIDFNTFQLIPAPDSSGAEEVAKLLPNSKVVKAFNTTFAGTLLSGEVDGKPLDVFIAGDDKAAKEAVSKLVSDAQLRPVDVGALSNARHLEGFTLLHMSLQEQLGTGWMSAIKILG
jgi:NADPH-dependent F420 reductase